MPEISGVGAKAFKKTKWIFEMLEMTLHIPAQVVEFCLVRGP
jgi:hypothetical protein